MITSFIRNYFGFNKQQRNGLLVLLLISVSLLIVRLIYPYFISTPSIVIEHLPVMESEETNVGITKGSQLFLFDPNKVSKEQLLQLGFTEKSATTFLNFKKRGFVFKQKSDLKKVYGVSDELYTTLEPWIFVEGREQRLMNAHPKQNLTTQSKQSHEKIELNTADSAALISLPGIGESFARRVIKYRTLLGGYVAIEQLREVYGFTDELFDKVKTRVSADPAKIKKINLNKDDFKTVNKHPYISYELTKTIFDWRRKTEITESNVKDVLNGDEALLAKLLPYLSF